jgi:ankyrin repeat protein
MNNIEFIPYGLSPNLDKSIDEIVNFKTQISRGSDILGFLHQGFGLRTSNILEGSNHHKVSRILERLSQHEQNFKDIIESLDKHLKSLIKDVGIADSFEINRTLQDTFNILEKVEGDLNSLFKDKQFLNTYQIDLKTDIDVVKALKWLLQFIQANICLQQNDFTTAYKLFSSLTSEGNKGYEIVKKTLSHTGTYYDVMHQMIKQLPTDILGQIELLKVYAYSQSFTLDDQRELPRTDGFKGFKILSDYLEDSIQVMMQAVAGKGKLPDKFFKPVLEAISQKASAELITHISGEFIVLGNYEGALELLDQARQAFKKSNSGNIPLELEIDYNELLSNYYVKDYEKVIEKSKKLSKFVSTVPSKYSDIMFVAYKASENLGQQPREALPYLDKALKYGGEDSIIANFIKNKTLEPHKLNELFVRTASTDNVGLLEIFIENGVDVNCKNKYGSTTLHEAAFAGQEEIVKFLLDSKVNLNCQGGVSNLTALELAVLNDKYKITDILLHHSNEIDNSWYQKAFSIATENGNKDILDLLVSKINSVNIAIDPLYKNSLIYHAVFGVIDGNKSCWKIIEWLLEAKDINPFIENDKGQTPRDILENFDWSYAEAYDDILETLGYYSDGSDEIASVY